MKQARKLNKSIGVRHLLQRRCCAAVQYHTTMPFPDTDARHTEQRQRGADGNLEGRRSRRLVGHAFTARSSPSAGTPFGGC